ncbi:MAG: hypothetical protein WBK76_05260 [Candidatus Saccharimonadales bacterium]
MPSERLATRSNNEASPFGEITPYDPTKVAGYEQLMGRFGDTGDTSVEASPEDPLTAPIEDTSESSPLFDELMAERTAAPAESSVGVSSSRLADLLRKGADRADAAAERWDDTKDRAKTKLRGFGRAALRAASATGEFTVGAGMQVANKGLELADRADAAFLDAADRAKESIKNTYNAAADRAGEAIMNGLASVENGADKVGDKLVDIKDGIKEKLAARKQAALKRRQARRDRWSQRWATAKETVNAGLDRSAELAMTAGAKLENGLDIVGTKMLDTQEAAKAKVERTRLSVRTTRAAGRAALDAYKLAKRNGLEQSQL